MANTVVRSFDLYNTCVLLPGYSVLGRENELNLSKNYYSTNFSSNVIGSKIDFFKKLCDFSGEYINLNPVLTFSTTYNDLDTLWFNLWWDEIVYYAHPDVYGITSITESSIFQSFSENVGTVSYINSENIPVSPIISGYIPYNFLTEIVKLNKNLNTSYNSLNLSAQSISYTTYNTQLANFNSVSEQVRSEINTLYPIINQKLPFNTNIVGNYVISSSWSHTIKVQGVTTSVNIIGNNIEPTKNLSVYSLNNKVGKKTPISNIAYSNLSYMPGVSNIINNLNISTGSLQSSINNLKGTIAQIQANTTNDLGGVQNTLNSVTGIIKPVSTSNLNTQQLSNITKFSGSGNVINTLKNQTTNNTLTNNAVISINSAVPSIQGRKATISVKTIKYDADL